MRLVVLLCGLIGLIGCQQNSSVSKDDIKKMLKENPEILVEAIEENPSKIIGALNSAVKKEQASQAKKREVDDKKKLEQSYNNPLTPSIRNDELIRGNKDGVLTLVEYSDFECPFCSRGFKTVLDFLEKYKGKVRFVYKHLPLNFHAKAMPASRYYEALRVQSHEMAIKFHDELYENQRKLQNGEKYLISIAKKLGADMEKLSKDVKSDKIQKRIDQDIAEAAKFGFQGTPGFLLNGVPVKGAYPLSHLEGIVKELEKRGKVKL